MGGCGVLGRRPAGVERRRLDLPHPGNERRERAGPDEAQVAAYTANLQDRLAPRIDSIAAEDAAAAPPGQAGLVWPKLDALGTAIAIGISVVLVLVVAGVIWALSTR